MNGTVDNVRVIERSLRAYVLALVSLVPLLGCPLAIQSLVLCRRVRAEVGHEWNPAGRYLKWAAILARLGIFITALALFGIFLALSFG